jgi:hypothetical protein
MKIENNVKQKIEASANPGGSCYAYRKSHSRRLSGRIFNCHFFDYSRMNKSAYFLCIIFMVIAISLVGCASTFGGTKAFTIPLGGALSELKGPVKVASVEMDTEASRLVYQDLAGFGKFDAKDLDNLRESICKTLMPASTVPVVENGLNFDLYVVVRTYIIYNTAQRFNVLACVAWCLADPSGEIVYHEQFFASDKGSSFGTTIGDVKMTLHRNLVRRIGMKALYVVKVHPPEHEPVFPGTYDDFDSTAKPLHLPDTVFVATSGLKTRMSGTQTIWYHEGITKDADWDRVEREGFINWKEYVAAQRSKNK